MNWENRNRSSRSEITFSKTPIAQLVVPPWLRTSELEQILLLALV